MERLLIAALLVVVAAAIALVLSRRRPDPPTQPRGEVPTQLDRHDFPRPGAAWLVAVFSSATCRSCAGALAKAKVLECDDVAVVDVEVGDQPELHRRYGIDAVPTIVIADNDGVVCRAFVGPPTATDLWAAVADAREPGSSPEAHLGRLERLDPTVDPASGGSLLG